MKIALNFNIFIFISTTSSLTPILSKIAEDYVVNDFVKPAVLKKIDDKQFGTIPKSCTTHALVSMTHNRYVSSDGNGATIRVVLFDFRKALDLIDHNFLVRKLLEYDIPNHILGWIADFLTDRRQRVKPRAAQSKGPCSAYINLFHVAHIFSNRQNIRVSLEMKQIPLNYYKYEIIPSKNDSTYVCVALSCYLWAFLPNLARFDVI